MAMQQNFSPTRVMTISPKPSKAIPSIRTVQPEIVMKPLDERIKPVSVTWSHLEDSTSEGMLVATPVSQTGEDYRAQATIILDADGAKNVDLAEIHLTFKLDLLHDAWFRGVGQSLHDSMLRRYLCDAVLQVNGWEIGLSPRWLPEYRPFPSEFCLSVKKALS